MSARKFSPTSLTSVRYAFWTIVWPRRKLLLVGLVLIVVNRLASLVLPGSSKFVIDNAIKDGDLQLLKLILFAVAVAILIQASTSFFLTRLLSVEAQHLISLLRSKVQEHCIYMPVHYFDNTKSGELVSRIMTDVEGVRNLVGTGLVYLLGGIFTVVVSLVLLIRIDAALTLYVLFPIVVFGVISMKAFGYIRPIFRKQRRLNAEVTGRLTESLNGIRVIKGFNAEIHEVKVFEGGVEKLFQNVKRSLTATGLMNGSAALLLGWAAVTIMWVGGSKIVHGEMTLGDFFAFTLYLGFVIAPVVEMSNIGSQMTEAFAGLDRTEEMLNVDREIDDDNRSTVLHDLKGDISFSNVTFAYSEGVDVLRDISFEAPAGTVTALVGSSGSGKSTIAGLASAFFKPQKGVVSVDGYDLSEATLDSYRSQLGVVLQDDFLFDGTIRDNILFGRLGASQAELQEVVAIAHVKEFTDRLDKGLETVIGERGVKLSGGQRQRVAIARALLANPRILILDEATSSLDAESELYIQQGLKVLMKGRTTLVIAHRLSTIRQAHQILVLEEGKIVERGTHDALIVQKGRYHQLYTYQAKI